MDNNQITNVRLKEQSPVIQSNRINKNLQNSDDSDDESNNGSLSIIPKDSDDESD